MLGLLAAAAGVPALGSLAGCSALGGNGADGDGTGTVTLAYLGDATQQKATEALYAEFERSHPKIKVRATGIAAGNWGSFANTVITQIAGGKKYDVINVATEGQQLLASKNVLEPLDRFIRRDQAVVDAYRAGIAPELTRWTREYGSPDGRTYYIPGGFNTVGLYCNTRVFERAGVDLPDPDWTWDEFRAAGRRIKARTGAFLVPLGDGSFPFVDIMPWLLTNGTSTMNADWTQSTLDSPAAVEAAEFVKSLLADGLAPPLGGTFDAPTQYSREKLATLPGGRWVTLDIRRLKVVDRTRVANWPTKRGNGTPVGWDGYPILKTSENKLAAWTLIKWVMSTAAGRFFAEQGGTTVPALRSVAAGSAFLDGAPAGSQYLARAIGFGTPIPSPQQGALTQQAITVGWRTAVTGLRPVREALAAASNQLQPLL